MVHLYSNDYRRIVKNGSVTEKLMHLKEVFTVVLRDLDNKKLLIPNSTKTLS